MSNNNNNFVDFIFDIKSFSTKTVNTMKQSKIKDK